MEIAKRHIIPKQIDAHGLTNKNVTITDTAIKKLISEYTREAGVRNLERELASVFRKLTKDIVVKESSNGKVKQKDHFIVDEIKVEDYLKIPRFRHLKHVTEKKIGSVTGLAWTSVGGELLNVDVTIMNGSEKLTLTGQLGNVMKESAQAALSYIRSEAKRFGLNPDFYKDKEVHIHLPEGAIPKDGPSAGITMAMALLSAVSGKPALNDVAMTGEITLRGNILPIGGLNEKLMAAKRNEIKTVLIPKDNEIDLIEIPEKVKDGLQIIPVDSVASAVRYVIPELIVSTKKEKSAKKKK